MWGFGLGFKGAGPKEGWATPTPEIILGGKNQGFGVKNEGSGRKKQGF